MRPSCRRRQSRTTTSNNQYELRTNAFRHRRRRHTIRTMQLRSKRLQQPMPTRSNTKLYIRHTLLPTRHPRRPRKEPRNRPSRMHRHNTNILYKYTNTTTTLKPQQYLRPIRSKQRQPFRRPMRRPIRHFLQRQLQYLLHRHQCTRPRNNQLLQLQSLPRQRMCPQRRKRPIRSNKRTNIRPIHCHYKRYNRLYKPTRPTRPM